MKHIKLFEDFNYTSNTFDLSITNVVKTRMGTGNIIQMRNWTKGMEGKSYEVLVEFPTFDEEHGKYLTQWFPRIEVKKVDK